MANNCYNSIEFNGDKKEIDDFFKVNNLENETNGTDLYSNLVEKYKSNGDDARWFDMYVERYSDENFYISGDSAWCPSLDLITNISKQYPSFVIRYEYEEPGCDFAGYADIQNGNCTDNCYTFWKGIFELRGTEEAISYILENELDSYENIEELKEADFWQLLDEEQQKEVLEAFTSNQS